MTYKPQLDKVSDTDLTPGFLIDKLVEGAGVTITQNNAGSDETLTISSSSGGIITALGDISNPPTETELETLLGAPADVGAGSSYVLQDLATNKYYLIVSTGSVFVYQTMLYPAGGTITPPPATILDIASNAGWCWFADPRALYYNGNVYFAWVSSNGYAFVNSFNTGTGIVGTPFSAHNVGADDHNNPTLLLRNSDKRLLLFMSGHDTLGFYARISTYPENVTAWGAEIPIWSQTGGQLHTYPTPIQLTGETNEPIYLFWRGRANPTDNAYWRYSKSTDGGENWSTYTQFVYETYAKIVQNGTDRIDFTICLHPTEGGDHSVFHFYYQGGNFYKSDGTQITSGLPLQPSDLTKVCDGASTNCWIWDIAINGSGNPVIIYTTFPTTSDHRYNYAVWSGSAWVTHEITAAGGGLYSPEIYYSGGAVLDHSNTNVVYLSKVVSGQYELYKYTTGDGGATWATVTITSGSSAKNIRPFVIRDHDNNYKVLWLYGTYNDYFNYNLTIKAGQ